MSALEKRARELLDDASDLRILRRRDLDGIKPLSWAIKSIIPVAGTGLIVGQSTAGKSFVSVDLLACVSLGLPWFGHRVRARPVLYVALEGQAGVKGRVEAWERVHRQSLPDGFRIMLTRLELVRDADRLSEMICVEGMEGAMIVIDTLAQASPGMDENSSSDMSRTIDALHRIQAATGGVVIGVHHMGKDVSRGARGHSSLYASCDFVLAVQRDGDNRFVSTDPAQGGKAKDAQEVSHQFELRPVHLCMDEDGEPVGSLAVVPVAGDARKPAKKDRLTPGQMVALAAFREASKDGSGVHLEDWREVFYRLSPADNEDTKRKAFSRAREALVSSGRMSVDSDMYKMAEGQRDRTGQKRDMSRSVPGQDGTTPYGGVPDVPLSVQVEVEGEFCPAPADDVPHAREIQDEVRERILSRFRDKGASHEAA